MPISRRSFLAATSLAALWQPFTAWAQSTPPDTRPFSLDDVIAEARRRAAEPYAPPASDLPESLADLGYDQYRNIWFNPSAAIWQNDPTDFRLDLFHRGFIYKDPVRIALVEGGVPTEIPFSRDLFTYAKWDQPPPDFGDIGFAGFRARYPINAQGAYQEVVAFLGASYFRAVARDQLYGLSARGLAIDTAEPEGEEFPAFQKFWVEKPGEGADSLTLYALLDSPSVAGAYRFEVTPGADTVIDVEAELFLRDGVKKIGIAPLTSMFLFSGMNRSGFDDYRRAVHDSDGLQMLTSNGEWIWRPLANPKTLQLSYFARPNPCGYVSAK